MQDTRTIFQRLKDSNNLHLVSHYYGSLYIIKTPETEKIVHKYLQDWDAPLTFDITAVDNKSHKDYGKQMYHFPWGYDPYFEEQHKTVRRREIAYQAKYN